MLKIFCKDVDGIGFVKFDRTDVLRHKLGEGHHRCV